MYQYNLYNGLSSELDEDLFQSCNVEKKTDEYIMAASYTPHIQWGKKSFWTAVKTILRLFLGRKTMHDCDNLFILNW